MEAARQSGASGRGPTVIGVDVGGTKVAAGMLDGHDARHLVDLPTHRSSADAVLADIERAVGSVVERCGEPAAIGVGVPSQVDRRSGTVVASVNIALAGVAVGRELSRRLGVPVYVDNDANCAAFAESHIVDQPPAQFLVMYTLGTGVGGGVVIGGEIYRGATGLAPELGHVVVDADGPPCPGSCPNRGCLEALCSGTALERDAAELARNAPDSAIGRRAAAQAGGLRGRDIVELARAGDADAIGLFERLATWLGVGLAGAINTFEPERIAIGGGLSTAGDLFLERACDEARRRALPPLAERVQIALALSGADAGVVGAGLLAANELRR